MLSTSTQGTRVRFTEIDLFRLRCADVGDDGRGVGGHDCVAPGVGPFRIIALWGKRVAYLHINEGDTSGLPVPPTKRKRLFVRGSS